MMPSEIEIHSPLSVSDAVARLRAKVGGEIPLLMLPASDPARPLRGWVGDRDFAVRLKTSYGNSFAAVCRGVVESTSMGPVVRANIGMSCATTLVLVGWTLGVLLVAVQAVSRRDLRGFVR
jgi:hypothetical protein